MARDRREEAGRAVPAPGAVPALPPGRRRAPPGRHQGARGMDPGRPAPTAVRHATSRVPERAATALSREGRTLRAGQLRSALVVLVVAAPPEARLVASLGGTVEPL